MHQQTRGGARLRAWLKEHDKTQEWIASRLGTHQTNVSAWMLGRPVPLDMALAIRRITKIPVEDWVVPSAPSKTRGVASTETEPDDHAEAS